MPRVQLTDRFCSTAPALGDRTDFFDTVVPGLALRVTEHGHRSWSYLFTSPRDGKRARATIGTYPATGLAAARARALEARGLVEARQDPRVALAGQGAAEMTVSDLVAAYLADPEKAALRSKEKIERRLNRNVVPLVGQVKLTALRRRDARNVVDAILRRGSPVEAARVFAHFRAMVSWALDREYLEVNPLDGMSKPADYAPRTRVLSDSEIRTVWTALPAALACSPECQDIIRLCLVTGQRVGEVSGLVRPEIDLHAREWRLPGSRTKNKHPHVVPLSDLAIEIIEAAMSRANAADALFPRGDGALAPDEVGRMIIRANRLGLPHWTAHDLRRTVLTEMGKLGIPPLVRGHVANHRSVTRAGVTLGVYDQYTYDKEKRDALDRWAARLRGIITGDVASIVRLARAS
jgi:integrase